MAVQTYSHAELQRFLAAGPDNPKKLGVEADGSYTPQGISTDSKSQLLQDFERGKLTICGYNRKSLDDRTLQIESFSSDYPPLKNKLLEAYHNLRKNDTWYYVGPIACLIEQVLRRDLNSIILNRHASNLLILLKKYSTIFPDNWNKVSREIDSVSDDEKCLYFALATFNILEQTYTSSVANGTSLGLTLPNTTIKIQQGRNFLSWNVIVARHSNDVGVTCTSQMPGMLSAATPKFYLQQISINGDPKTINNCNKFLNPNFSYWPKGTRHEYRLTPKLFDSLSEDKLKALGVRKDGGYGLNTNSSNVQTLDENILDFDLRAGRLKLQSQSLRAIQPTQVKSKATKLLGAETYGALKAAYKASISQCLVVPVLQALNQNTHIGFDSQITEANFYCLKGEWILFVKGVIEKKQTVSPQSQTNILKYYGLLSLGAKDQSFTLQYLLLESLTGTGTYINLFTNYFTLDDEEVVSTYRMGATEQLEEYKGELSKRTQSCFDMRSFTGRLSGGAHKTAQVKIAATDKLITLIQGGQANITTNQLAAINDGQLSQILRTDIALLIASETYDRLVDFNHIKNQQRVSLQGDASISTPFGEAKKTTSTAPIPSATFAIIVINGKNSFSAEIQHCVNRLQQQSMSRSNSPSHNPFDTRSSTDSNSSVYSLDTSSPTTTSSASSSTTGSPFGSALNSPNGSPNGSGRDFASISSNFFSNGSFVESGDSNNSPLPLGLQQNNPPDLNFIANRGKIMASLQAMRDRYNKEASGRFVQASDKQLKTMRHGIINSFITNTTANNAANFKLALGTLQRQNQDKTNEINRSLWKKRGYGELDTYLAKMIAELETTKPQIHSSATA